jgi:uncharacterized DUF497 family protein
MRLQWDENKRRSNLEKHGLDFADAWKVFADPEFITSAVSGDFGEVRYKTIGKYQDTIITVVVHTNRAGAIRIISFRPASQIERSKYYGVS